MPQSIYRLHFTRARGLTLTELVTAVSLLSILVSLGVPGLKTMQVKTQQSALINGFSTLFHQARSQAILEETRQILCPSEDNLTCQPGNDWSRGLIQVTDADRNGLADPGEPVIALFNAEKNSEIAIHSSPSRTQVHYLSDGRPSGYNLTLAFCDPQHRVPGKYLIVNNVGRIRVSDRVSRDSSVRCEE
ncbi:MAG: GspH/FimT family pseudopilin [Candidatus Thiodiazotropha sp.]